MAPRPAVPERVGSVIVSLAVASDYLMNECDGPDLARTAFEQARVGPCCVDGEGAQFTILAYAMS